MKKIVLLTALLALICLTSASVKVNPIELCECEQTKEKINITNFGGGAFYTLSLYTDSQTSGFVENKVFVEAHSTVQIPLWLSTCQLGETTAKLVVESNNELQSIEIPVKISTCKKLGLSVQAPKLICAGQTAEYKITVSNLGKKEISGSVKTDLNIPHDATGEVFVIPAMSSKEAKISVYVPKDVGVGQTQFLIKAVSQDASAESVQKMVVSDCTSSQVSLQEEIQLFSSEQANVNATIYNNGKFNETFKLELLCPSFVKTSSYSIFVEKNSSKKISLNFAPGDFSEQKEFDCKIIARAQNGERFTNSTKIIVWPSDAIRLSSDADGATACLGDKITVNYTLTNEGRKQNLYEYIVKGPSAELSAKNASIPANTSGRVKLSIDSSKLAAGEYDYEVSAKTGKALVVREFKLELIDCNASFEFTLKPIGVWEVGKANELKAVLDNQLYNISGAKLLINSEDFQPIKLTDLVKGKTVEKTLFVIANQSGEITYDGLLYTGEFNLSEKFKVKVVNNSFEMKVISVKKQNASYEIELKMFNKASETNVVLGFDDKSVTKTYVGANSGKTITLNSSSLGLLTAETNRGTYVVTVKEIEEKHGFFTGLVSAANLTFERSIILLLILLFVFLVFLYRGKKIIESGKKKNEGVYYG